MAMYVTKSTRADTLRIIIYESFMFQGYLGVSMALGKAGAAGWLLGDRPPPPREELYSSRGDWKATWGCSGGGISLSRTPIFSLLARLLDGVSLSPDGESSKTR